MNDTSAGGMTARLIILVTATLAILIAGFPLTAMSSELIAIPLIFAFGLTICTIIAVVTHIHHSPSAMEVVCDE